MGACLSSAGDSIHKSTYALVISNKGELRQYPTPIFVSEVLLFETHPSSNSDSYFLCNSDNLYFDQHIPALDSEDELDAGQIYFILPKKMLGRRLSASDMAALAVKASVALDSNANDDSHVQKKKKKNNNNNARISPMVLMEASQINVVVDDDEYKKRGLRVSRSGSIRKMPAAAARYSSKKNRLAAVRSFRLRLSTIYENEGCDHDQYVNY